MQPFFQRQVNPHNAAFTPAESTIILNYRGYLYTFLSTRLVRVREVPPLVTYIFNTGPGEERSHPVYPFHPAGIHRFIIVCLAKIRAITGFCFFNIDLVPPATDIPRSPSHYLFRIRAPKPRTFTTCDYALGIFNGPCNCPPVVHSCLPQGRISSNSWFHCLASASLVKASRFSGEYPNWIFYNIFLETLSLKWESPTSWPSSVSKQHTAENSWPKLVDDI